MDEFDDDYILLWVIVVIGIIVLLLLIVCTIYLCCQKYHDERDYTANQCDKPLLNKKIGKYKPPVYAPLSSSSESSDTEENKTLKRLEKQYDDLFPKKSLLDLRNKGNSIPIEEREKVYRLTIEKLLEAMSTYQASLFTVVTKDDEQVDDQKGQYRMYGLMLNACVKQGHINHCSADDVKVNVSTNYSFLNGREEIIDISVRKALSVTWSMLTLLPPLLVTTDEHIKYSEEIHDTNRHTWDEDKSGPLYYYRPVLVSGNALNVAVKGLVGNTPFLS